MNEITAVNTTWPNSLTRLETIRQSDPGLYAVALHAFIEGEAGKALLGTRDMNFRDIIQTWWRDHKEDISPSLSAGQESDLLSVLMSITAEHRLTNPVRHRFARLAPEEARGVTWNFLRLGDYTGWSALPESKPLRGSLESWDERTSAAEDTHLADLKTNFTDLQSRSAELLLSRPLLESKESEILKAKKQLMDLDSGSPEAIAVQDEIRRLRTEIDTSDYRRYIDSLSRFSLTARTRRDFEKHLVRLTPEQREALEDFSADKDLLITGSAGTGKTLVLLEALSRTLKGKTPELTLGQPNQTSLITFTNTLVKYDRYLAGLMAPGLETDLESSETFFWKKLKTKEPNHKVDYKLLQEWIPEVNNTGVLSDGELWIEIEEFLFGLNVGKEEYLDAAVPRRGLKTPLNLKEREQVWAIRLSLAERMITKGAYSKHFARLRLLEWLKTHASRLVTHESLFVDESQDMAAVELMCLKALTGRSLIMAGDTGQSIYGFINPYRRAKLELGQKQIRLLKTNHRNTIPIHNLAEDYRRSGLATGEDPGPQSYPFREGPDPEMHQGDNPDILADLLAAKAHMYVADLGYDPEAIGILCSRTAHLAMMAKKLAAVGLRSAVVRGDAFSFTDRGVVRLSTLHSSKGLDFPVVLMYLPGLPPAREIDPAYQERLWRNLVYVAMSRGMDVVEMFKNPEI